MTRMRIMTSQRIACAAALLSLLTLAGCGDNATPTGRCVLDAEAGTDRTRVADCEFSTNSGDRVRMVMIQHVDPELGLLDAEFRGFRIHPDGRVERLSDVEASEALSGSDDLR